MISAGIIIVNTVHPSHSQSPSGWKRNDSSQRNKVKISADDVAAHAIYFVIMSIGRTQSIGKYKVCKINYIQLHWMTKRMSLV